MKPSEALAAHRNEIREIVLAHRAVNARVFGSVVHGSDTDESDLDIFVDTTPDATLFDLTCPLPAYQSKGRKSELKVNRFLCLRQIDQHHRREELNSPANSGEDSLAKGLTTVTPRQVKPS